MDKGGWSASVSDMLWALLRRQIAKDAEEERTRNDIFTAGTTRDTNMLGFEEAPSFNVAVGAVFYADGSYDKPDEAAFKQMLADRQNRLLTMKKTNEIIQSALATTNDHPVAVAIIELAKSAAETMANNNSETLYDHLKVGEVQMVIQKLEEFATTVVLRAAKGQDRARAPHTILGGEGGRVDDAALPLEIAVKP